MPIQTHPRSTSTNAVQTVAAHADPPGPRVWDTMTVEVALSIMAAAQTGRLVICDEDGHRVGLVTLTRLTAVRDGSGYTDRIRLRDIAGALDLYASSPDTTAEAEHGMRHRPLGTPPMAGEHGRAPGVFALSR
ncbi:CBS domain-containing protein [Streptomyces incarnatus]|nr:MULTISPECIES: CBS domain-containing protein [Streptomyces]